MREKATAAPSTAGQPLPEAAVAFLHEFHKWALSLTLDDLKQVIAVLQTLRAAHVQESGQDVPRTS